MTNVISFIGQYWLQTLLGLVSMGLGFLAKKFWSLYKSEQQHQKTKEQEEFYESIKQTVKEVGKQSREGDMELQDQIDDLKAGVLAVQRKTFMEECHYLLKEDHKINLEEFEIINADYEAYKKLGGNGQGKALFAMVQKKAMDDIAD